MITPLLGMLVSATLVVFFIVLFRVEEARGRRFASGMRSHLDRGVATFEASFEKTIRFIGREMPRQSLHYFFHTILVSLLHLLRRSERGVDAALRSNRVMARRVTGEHTIRDKNKLDEIAEHKASMAFSEEEKRRYKDEMLEG